MNVKCTTPGCNALARLPNTECSRHRPPTERVRTRPHNAEDQKRWRAQAKRRREAAGVIA